MKDPGAGTSAIHIRKTMCEFGHERANLRGQDDCAFACYLTLREEPVLHDRVAPAVNTSHSPAY